MIITTITVAVIATNIIIAKHETTLFDIQAIMSLNLPICYPILCFTWILFSYSDLHVDRNSKHSRNTKDNIV